MIQRLDKFPYCRILCMYLMINDWTYIYTYIHKYMCVCVCVCVCVYLFTVNHAFISRRAGGWTRSTTRTDITRSLPVDDAMSRSTVNGIGRFSMRSTPRSRLLNPVDGRRLANDAPTYRVHPPV